MEIRFFSVVFTLFVSLTTASEDAEAGTRLLVSKQLCNKYFVQEMDLIAKYTLYNVGSSPAYDVKIKDTSFHPDMFAVVGGKLEAHFPRIPPGTNVSHVVVLRPTRVGLYNFTAAEVTYSPEENGERRVAISSEPGEGYIVAFREYDKKFSPHFLDWIAFLVMTLPSLAIPCLLWWKSKSKYENLSRAKAQKKD